MSTRFLLVTPGDSRASPQTYCESGKHPFLASSIYILVSPCQALQWVRIFTHLIPASHNSVSLLHSSVVDQLYPKEVHFCIFVTKSNVPNKYQIFTQMYSTVSIGPSYLECPTHTWKVPQDFHKPRPLQRRGEGR